MSIGSLIISIIAIVIVGVLAWNALGGGEDLERLRRRMRRRDAP